MIRFLLGGSPLAMVVTGTVLTGLAIAGLQGFGYMKRQIGRAEGAAAVITKLNVSAEGLGAKANKARDRADGVSDPVAELRKRRCGDC